MDDFYLVHTSKDFLQDCLACIRCECAHLGITLNERKTGIVKLSHGFTWLKKRISFTETGRIVVRPSRGSVTRERRKLKRMARLVESGEMTMGQVAQSYQSWRGGMMRLDAHGTVLSMDRLYEELFGSISRG